MPRLPCLLASVLPSLAALLLAGCSHAQSPPLSQPSQQAQQPSQQPPQPPQHTAPPQADLLSQLRGLERSCSSQAQCRTVPVGAKPCGGPEGYLPYSTARNDPAQVTELAVRHRAQRAADNQRRGIAGDCMMVPDPGAVCLAGSCELGGNPRDK